MDNAVVGQRGSIWFLAGVFSGGTVVRYVFVPQGTALFFPVVNQINIRGQGSNNLSVGFMRGLSLNFINGVSNPSVTVDGIVIKKVPRVRSVVFEIALPKDNLFVPGAAWREIGLVLVRKCSANSSYAEGWLLFVESNVALKFQVRGPAGCKTSLEAMKG